jgi:hypothetical protein
MKDGGIDAGMEITVGQGLELLIAPIVLGQFWPTVGERLCPYAVLATAPCSTEGSINLLLAELAVVNPELGSHLVGGTAIGDTVGGEGAVSVGFAPRSQSVFMGFLCQSTHILRCHEVGYQTVEVFLAVFILVVERIAISLLEFLEDRVGVVLLSSFPTVDDYGGECRSVLGWYAP